MNCKKLWWGKGGKHGRTPENVRRLHITADKFGDPQVRKSKILIYTNIRKCSDTPTLLRCVSVQTRTVTDNCGYLQQDWQRFTYSYGYLQTTSLRNNVVFSFVYFTLDVFYKVEPLFIILPIRRKLRNHLNTRQMLLSVTVCSPFTDVPCSCLHEGTSKH